MLQVYLFDSEDEMVRLIICGLSALFILVPILQAMFSFQHGIRKWRRDTDNGTIVQSWLAENLRTMYFIVALTGGSPFAAVILCNSVFLDLQIFDMGLTRRQRRVFRNKRVFSAVILENVPQFILQIAFSIINKEWTFITIFASFFSIVSILVTMFEFCTQRVLISSETYQVVKFTVKSDHIALMTHKEFRKQISNIRKAAERDIARVVGIGPESVELLKPIQVKDGVALTFYIVSEKLDGAQIQSALKPEIENRRLVAVKSTL